MKQIIQSLADGRVELLEVPVPSAGRGALLIQTELSLISAGTERMLLNFGRANWLNKARQQPDKVRQVLDKVRTDGLAATLDSVRSKLDQPITPGYCNVGRVVEVGSGVAGFSVGDLVASNGPHAQFVSVPQNLCAKVPPGVSADTAVFTVLSAIALQGIRLAEPTVGECFVVIGLGLVGQLATQILRAQGCRVLGIDPDDARLALAREFGAETASTGGDPLAMADVFSRRRGVDGVLICAATNSDEPVRQAARMCRKRGRIVLVGVAGLSLSRDDFFQKELSFQVSCSYGPGRYDPNYEAKGHDYPVGFVRWTEQRNFEAILDLMAAGSINTAPLITHRFGIDASERAYDALEQDSNALGILLEYPTAQAEGHRAQRIGLSQRLVRKDDCRVVALGAGNYASRVLLPAMIQAGCEPVEIVSAKGMSAAHVGRKLGFSSVSTDDRSAIERPDADTVVIATRHDSHSTLVQRALENGKHVFCEKPLCLTQAELEGIGEAVAKHPQQLLIVGFNRRFSPLTNKIRSLLANARDPKVFIMTVNAGAIPADHWVHDRAQGGGRIIGEACHFVDLLRHLAASPIDHASAVSIGQDGIAEDKAALTLRFADGSIGTIHYLANGHSAFPKERLEIFTGGKILQLDNWRTLRGWGWPGFSKMHLRKADKGVANCCSAFVEAIRGGLPAPIPWPEIEEVSKISIALAEELR